MWSVNCFCFELVTRGGFMALLLVALVKIIYTLRNIVPYEGVIHEHSPLSKALSKSTISAGGGFDGSDSHETFFHDYMAGTRRDDTDISPAAGPPLREASLAGKFRWQGLLGAPWRKLSGTSYAWPHGFQNLSKGNSALKLFNLFNRFWRYKHTKIYDLFKVCSWNLLQKQGFFSLPTFFFGNHFPCKCMGKFERFQKSWLRVSGVIFRWTPETGRVEGFHDLPNFNAQGEMSRVSVQRRSRNTTVLRYLFKA